jgi:hypothetical protein
MPPTAKPPAFMLADIGRILETMPPQEETWESYFGERRPPSGFRLFKRQLALERKYAERLIESLHRAIGAEMELMDQRIIAKLEDIDASLSLIAIELSRRDDARPSSDVGV